MDIENDRMKKFLKKSALEPELYEKKIGSDNLTNIEAFQQGKFPEKLVEKFKTPETLPDKSLFADIEAKHKEIAVNHFYDFITLEEQMAGESLVHKTLAN